MENNEQLLECVEFMTKNTEFLQEDDIAHFERLHGYYLKEGHEDNLFRIVEFVEHLRKTYDL